MKEDDNEGQRRCQNLIFSDKQSEGTGYPYRPSRFAFDTHDLAPYTLFPEISHGRRLWP